MYYVDYPRHQHSKESCEKYFWKKLYKSLTYVPRELGSSDGGVSTRDPPRLCRGQSDGRPMNYGPRNTCTSGRPQAQPPGPERPLNYGPQAQGHVGASQGVPGRQPLNYEPRTQGRVTGAPERPLNYGPRTQGQPLNYGPRTQGRATERPLNYGHRTAMDSSLDSSSTR